MNLSRNVGTYKLQAQAYVWRNYRTSWIFMISSIAPINEYS